MSTKLCMKALHLINISVTVLYFNYSLRNNFLNFNAIFTNMINAGTATNGPTSPVNASGELNCISLDLI